MQNATPARVLEDISVDSPLTPNRSSQKRKPNPVCDGFFCFDQKARESLNQFETGMVIEGILESEKNRVGQATDNAGAPSSNSSSRNRSQR